MPKPRVVVYTRPGCHLCERALEAIRAARCDAEYTLEQVNIETDPQLLQSYKNDIPVIAIDGVEVFRHRVSAEAFKARILRRM